MAFFKDDYDDDAAAGVAVGMACCFFYDYEDDEAVESRRRGCSTVDLNGDGNGCFFCF